MLKYFLILSLFCGFSEAFAKKNNKIKNSKTVQQQPDDSYGSAEAVSGGTLTMNLIGEPPTVHPITAMDLSALTVHDWTMGTLLVKDPRTFDWKSSVAERWEISRDGKIFTFWLRPNVTFHDGHPVTAEDVKFSFDAIFDPQYKAASRIPYFENIAKVEVLDAHQVKFYSKDSYFLNFDVAAGMYILPKHIYGDVEKSKKMNKELVGCGPYKLELFDRGNKIVLKKYKDWFGSSLPLFRGLYNFETIQFRLAKEENIYMEMLNRGDLDYQELSPEEYSKKTEGGNWGKTVNKFKAENSLAKGYRYVAWNLENNLFKDKNIRKALAYLMNREEMNQKFRFGLSVLATGPTDIFSDYAPSSVKPLGFDVSKAQALLAQAGWKDSDKDGVLDKVINGKKTDFRFTLVHSNKDYEKYLTMYKEDLKKNGIEMEIKYLEWNSFLKNIDSGKFEAMSMAWTTAIDFDPKAEWHSTSAVSGGSNFIHYKVPEVDQMIDQARVELDRNKRIQLLRKVYERIANDYPYVFMFNEKYSLYALNARVGQVVPTFKYSLGIDSWWVKP